MLPLRIARRYLLSRRLPGAVNIITLIALTGITVGAAALIMALSVFNGFHTLLRDLFQDFDADIRITATTGKYLPDSDSLAQRLATFPGIEAVSRTLEGRAVLKYPDSDQEHIVQLVGVDRNFAAVSRYAGLVYIGRPDVVDEYGMPQLVMGAGVAYYTRANIYREDRMTLYTVSETANLEQDADGGLRMLRATPAGFFTLQKEYDDNIVLTDLEAARRFFDLDNKVSTYQLRLTDRTTVADTKAALAQALGPNYRLDAWFEQHQTLYEVMNNEKWVAFMVVTFMLILAGVNIVGCLTMVVLAKRRDIAVLQAQGMTGRQIAAIFLWEGLLLGTLAAGLGLGIGLGLVYLQQEFHVLKLAGGANFIIDHYPVQIVWADVLSVAVVVVALGTVAGLYPALRAARLNVVQNLTR